MNIKCRTLSNNLIRNSNQWIRTTKTNSWANWWAISISNRNDRTRIAFRLFKRWDECDSTTRLKKFLDRSTNNDTGSSSISTIDARCRWIISVNTSHRWRIWRNNWKRKRRRAKATRPSENSFTKINDWNRTFTFVVSSRFSPSSFFGLRFQKEIHRCQALRNDYEEFLVSSHSNSITVRPTSDWNFPIVQSHSHGHSIARWSSWRESSTISLVVRSNRHECEGRMKRRFAFVFARW